MLISPAPSIKGGGVREVASRLSRASSASAVAPGEANDAPPPPSAELQSPPSPAGSPAQLPRRQSRLGTLPTLLESKGMAEVADMAGGSKAEQYKGGGSTEAATAAMPSASEFASAFGSEMSACSSPAPSSPSPTQITAAVSHEDISLRRGMRELSFGPSTQEEPATAAATTAGTAGPVAEATEGGGSSNLLVASQSMRVPAAAVAPDFSAARSASFGQQVGEASPPAAAAAEPSAGAASRKWTWQPRKTLLAMIGGGGGGGKANDDEEKSPVGGCVGGWAGG